jgi:quercetin dioxygenase-like cupin family protein
MSPMHTTEDETIPVDDRWRRGPGGGRYRIVATSEETRNTHLSLIVTEPPGGGPPLHLHEREDEFFVVLEGEMTFWIDGRVMTLVKDASAFVPRGVAHAFKNRSDRAARVLVVFTPGGIDGFFDYGRVSFGQVPSDDVLLDRIARLAPAFGLQVLGPCPL